MTLVTALLALTTLAPAQQFTVPRPLPGDVNPVPTAGRQIEADLAAGDSVHLAVWVDGRSSETGIASAGGFNAWGKEDIYGRRLDASGLPLGRPFLIARLPFEARRPRAAWNGVDTWLVIWEARRVTQTTTTVGIRGVRVRQDGTLLDDPPLVIDDVQGVDENFADVAGQNGEWMCAWSDVNPISGNRAVFGSIIAADGSEVTRRKLGEGTPGFVAPFRPSLAAAGGRYLVAWEHYGPGGPGWNVYGRVYDSALAPMSTEFPIGTSFSETHAHAASNGAEFLVTWSGAAAARVSLTGTVSPPGGTVLGIAAANSSNGFAPATWMQDRWIVTGTSLSGDVLIEELDTNVNTITSGVLLNRAGRTLEPTISAIGGRAVVAWREDVLEYSDVASTWVQAGLSHGAVSLIGEAAPTQVRVDIDGDPQHGYMVVWLDAVSGSRRLMAQRLGVDGQAIDAEPIVVHEPVRDSTLAPRVARGATEWFVVWPGRNAAGEVSALGKRVSFGGQLMDAQPLELLAGDTPDIDYEGGVYLVVTTHEPTNHFRYVRATRVTPAGVPLDSPYLTIGGSYSRIPRVASTGGRFLVAWQQSPSHDSPSASIVAAFVEPVGTFGLPFGVESAPGPARGPRVGAGNGEFFVTFSADGDVWGRSVDLNGGLSGSPGGHHLTFAGGSQVSAAAHPHGSGWITAWTDYRIHPPLEAGIGDVWCARLDTNETLLDLDGIPVATGPWIDGDVALAGDATEAIAALAAWSDVHGSVRIHVARLAVDQIGQRMCSPSVPNSSGTFASMYIRGSQSAFSNDITLHVEGAPTGSFGYFLASETQAVTHQPGGSQGVLCLGGTVARFAANIFQIDAAGTASFAPDLSAIPIGPGIPVFPGETWSFQAWFRDANPQVTSNFSDATAVQFQ